MYITYTVSYMSVNDPANTTLSSSASAIWKTKNESKIKSTKISNDLVLSLANKNIIDFQNYTYNIENRFLTKKYCYCNKNVKKPDKILKLNYNIENITTYKVNLNPDLDTGGYSKIETATTPLYDDNNNEIGYVSFYRFLQSTNGKDIHLTEQGNYFIGKTSIISYENSYSSNDSSIPYKATFLKFNILNTYGEFVNYTGTIDLNLLEKYNRKITIFLYKRSY